MWHFAEPGYYFEILNTRTGRITRAQAYSNLNDDEAVRMVSYRRETEWKYYR